MSEPTESPPRCDFCFAANPKWIVPAKAFSVMVDKPEGVKGPIGVRSVDEWYACTICAKLVQTSQWNRLLRRVVDSWGRRYEVPMPPKAVETLRRTYVQLRENMTGPVRRMD